MARVILPMDHGHGQLIIHGELYYKYKKAKLVDISLEKTYWRVKNRQTGLGRQDTNINHSI